MKRPLTILMLASILAGGATAQQAPPKAPPALAVGTKAPAFTLKAATRNGVQDQPVSLADLKGQTVVLAFFPRARTGGCTAQMNAYREQYETLFKGENVKMFAVSTDADTTLAAWAAEGGYPVTFLSDPTAETSRQYQVARETRIGTIAARVLYIIDGDGNIAHVMAPFRETDPTAYTELREAVGKVSGR
jgi:peroxiredoxin